MKKPPRKQHIQPRAYLARFEDASGRLWVYEASKELRLSCAKREATQRDYFEVKLPGEETNYEMEIRLSKLEDDSEPVVHKLIKAESLTLKDIQVWSLFVATIFLRSRKVRDDLTAFAMKGAHEILINDERLRANQWELYRLTGRLHPIEELRAAALRVAQKFDDPAFRHNQTLCNNTVTVASALSRKGWCIVKPAEGKYFVTSDAPAFSYIIENDLLYPGYGWGREDAFVALPLSPSKMFVAAPPGRSVTTQYDDVSTDTLNKAIVAFADRFVYANANYEHIANLVANHIGQVRFGIDAYVPTSTSAA